MKPVENPSNKKQILQINSYYIKIGAIFSGLIANRPCTSYKRVADGIVSITNPMDRWSNRCEVSDFPVIRQCIIEEDNGG
uniref:Uncharacterized protein n=1 Tax=viral metagenome TaxID=1070528 RepID=A0A6M3ISK9_9ZZZZ